MPIIFFRTLILYTIVTAVLRLMGKRQVGELESSELVTTLFLSEIATIPLSDPEVPLLFALIPVLLIVSLEIIVTYSKNKLHFLKRVFEGKPSFLIYRGELRQKELESMRISIEELLGELRILGYGDISDVYYAILEENGKLSVLPKSSACPPTAEDLKLKIPEAGIAHPVILDGSINTDIMEHLQLSEDTVTAYCRKEGYTVKDIFLMTVNDLGERRLIPKEEKRKDGKKEK